MKEHDEANKILNMKTRKEQVEYWKQLPDKIKQSVGSLVNIGQQSERNGVIPAWRK